MKTIYIFFISFCMSWTVNGTSLKSPETVTFSNVRILLEIYKNKYENKLPDNWQDFIDSGILSGEVLNNSRRFLDIENRYIFVDLKPMELGNQNERILIIARQSGGEGDNNDAEDPEKRPGRWLIVEASDGSIQTRKYSEVMLKLWFAKAGLSLADFTFAAPPPPKFDRPPNDPKSKGLTLGGPENPSDGSTQSLKNLSKRENKPRSPTAADDVASTDPSSWGIWVAGGISLATFFVWIVLRKQTAH